MITKKIDASWLTLVLPAVASVQPTRLAEYHEFTITRGGTDGRVA